MRRVVYPRTECHVVWKRLIPMTPGDKTSPSVEVFQLLFSIMLTHVDFEPPMPPFCNRPDIPEWFTIAFPPPRNKDKNNSLVIWRHFLVAQFLLAVIVGTIPDLVSYQPNLVARQFGLCQFIPKSLFPSFEFLFNITSDQPYDVFRVDVENFLEKKPKLGYIPFQPSF